MQSTTSPNWQQWRKTRGTLSRLKPTRWSTSTRSVRSNLWRFQSLKFLRLPTSKGPRSSDPRTTASTTNTTKRTTPTSSRIPKVLSIKKALKVQTRHSDLSLRRPRSMTLTPPRKQHLRNCRVTSKNLPRERIHPNTNPTLSWRQLLHALPIQRHLLTSSQLLWSTQRVRVTFLCITLSTFNTNVWTTTNKTAEEAISTSKARKGQAKLGRYSSTSLPKRWASLATMRSTRLSRSLRTSPP